MATQAQHDRAARALRLRAQLSPEALAAKEREEKCLHACEKGDVDEVASLIAAGVNVEHCRHDMTGLGCAHIAAKGGHAELLELLLSKGVHVDVRDGSGKTPLLWAAGMGHNAIVELLLKSGASIEEKDAFEFTPLLEAARENRPETASLLLSRGAAVNARAKSGYTALAHAADKGFASVVAVLLDGGADRSIRTSSDVTPMQLALFGHHSAVTLEFSKPRGGAGGHAPPPGTATEAAPPASPDGEPIA